MNPQAIDPLLKEDRLRRLNRPAWDQVDRLLAASEKDLKTVRKILEIDEARAYDVAYDAMFKSEVRKTGHRDTCIRGRG